MTNELTTVAEQALALAKKKGAQGASARIDRSRDVSVEWRDGQVDSVKEATTRSLSLELYVDGRYSSVSTRDLRPDALDTFVADSVAMARAITKDPYRELPPPELFKGREEIDLKIDDPGHESVSPERRKETAKALEAASRDVPGKESIISVSTFFNDSRMESVRLTSNGFRGSRVETQFWIGSSVSVKDPDGRKPEDGFYAGTRFAAELPAAAEVGRLAAERALGKIGAKKPESAVMTMAVENRSGRRLVGQMLSPMSAWSIQQKRSFLEGKIGEAIASKLLTVVDDPLVPKGLGSRLYDDEGITARRLPLVEEGVLKSFYVDTYYGKKLGLAPTTGRSSNLAFTLGVKGQAELLADMKEGILVTGFLGGNANSATGDFSLGVSGYRVREGKLAEPVSELNIAGNQVTFWKSLVAVGNDPYPYSPSQTPTLVFEGVQFAGV